jgi:hypothetical protein
MGGLHSPQSLDMFWKTAQAVAFNVEVRSVMACSMQPGQIKATGRQPQESVRSVLFFESVEKFLKDTKILYQFCTE